MSKNYLKNQIICGDCLEIIKDWDLSKIDAVVTDPPYGINWNTDYSRFTKNAWDKKNKKYKKINNDNKLFNPSIWLNFEKVILWGANYFSNNLPIGTWLVWKKRRDSKLGKFLSDCELAWMKNGKGVYLYFQEWDGFMMEGESGKRAHPTQKPIMLMRWCLKRLGLKRNDLVLDPYCGSGSTCIACKSLGINYIGIDIDSEYCELAKRRLKLKVEIKEKPNGLWKCI